MSRGELLSEPDTIKPEACKEMRFREQFRIGRSRFKKRFGGV